MFKISELIKATGGELISGNPDGFVSGISIDSRTIKQSEAYLAIKGNNFDGHSFIDEAVAKGATCVVIEGSKDQRIKGSGDKGPGVVVIQVNNTTKALGDIAKFQREKFNGIVIAITGSNGKTTTKDMVACVLGGQFRVLKNPGTKNNHIGVPLSLLDLDNSYDAAVLEIGTNHHGEVGYLGEIVQPNIALITNIGPSHLEFFKNLDGVYKEKITLLDHLKKPYLSVLNADDKLLKKSLIKKSDSKITLSVGLKNHCEFRASKIRNTCHNLGFCVNGKDGFTLESLGFLNVYNALMAIACGRILGMGYEDIMGRLAQFSFPEDRLQLRELQNIKFINDTYNANPVSLNHALDVLETYPAKGRRIFVMGDMMELGLQRNFFHCQAGERVAQVCDAFISVGKLTRLAAEAAKSSGLSEKNIYVCENSSEAREILFNKVSPTPNDIVLVKGSRAMKMEEVFNKTN